MFKKIKCEHCEHVYDEALNECPKCHAENGNLATSFKHLEMFVPIKQASLFLIGCAFFQVLSLIFSLIISKTSLIKLPNVQVGMILNALVYSTTFIILLGVLNKDVIRLAKSFKRWKSIIAGVGCLFVMFAFNFIYNLILYSCGVNISGNGNQQSLDNTALAYPFTSIIIFAIIGPICEELTYRVGLFGFFKRFSNWIAYPVCGIVFALIHFSFSGANLANELLNLPFYIFAGLALSFVYDKFGFAGSLTAHVLNNLISFIPMSVFIEAIL